MSSSLTSSRINDLSCSIYSATHFFPSFNSFQLRDFSGTKSAALLNRNCLSASHDANVLRCFT
ncbi:hypothetical protein CW304_18165 [Bacillus sp. UFRGS-B20]|nr:hypothetical protein CW304_18165 [Bacillus sp. UFRGS-B20]